MEATLNPENDAGSSAADAPQNSDITEVSAPEPAPIEPKPTEPPKAEEPVQDGSEVQKPKAIGGFKRKLLRLEAENAALRAQIPQAAPQAPAKEPTAEDFKLPDGNYDWDKYNQAIIDHRVDRKLGERDQKTAQDQTRQQLQGKIDKFEASKDQLRETIPDFDDVLDAYDGPQSVNMHMAIINSENSGEVAYHLASHPEEAAQLAQMGLIDANRYVARLEGKLEAQKSQAKAAVKTTTKAPPPVSPVKPGAKSGTIDLENCSYEEFKEWDKKNKVKR